MKKNYKELLKESILKEFDTSKNIDVKGPMLDAILSYNGAGELPTHQDASSILERYYYGEKLDKGVEIHEAEQNEISEVPKDSIEATKNEVVDELGGDEPVDKRELGGDAIEEDIEIENTVIEKLIAEMDDDGEKKDEDEDEGEGKELDVDKKLTETSSGGALPGFKTSTGYRLGTGGNVSTDLEEAFQLFQEQVEDEEDEDEDEDEKPLKEAEEKEEDEDDEDLKESELFEAEENDGDDDEDDEDEDDLEECKYMK